ncbi:MAG: hypothetical protein IJE59_01625 [Clostridia bacterium]|nr:hypothetical protein [Clostridia bacterium]
MGKTIRFDISKSLAMNFAVFENDLKKIAENHGIPVTEAIDQFVLDLENYGKEGYTKKIDEITLGGLTPSILAGLISYMNKMKKAYERKEQNDKKRKEQEERKKSKDSDKKEFEEKINNLISEQKAETQLDSMKMILKDINNGNYAFDTTKEKRKIVREIEKRIELEEEKEKRIVQENAQKEAKEQARQAEIQRKTEEEKERQEEIQRKVDEAWQSIQGVAKREIKKRNIKESQYWIAIRKKFVEQSQGR